MLEFFIGNLVGIVLGVSLIGSIYVSTKAYKVKDINYIRYLMIDDIWMRSSLDETITTTYNNKQVSVYVKANDIEGTNNDACLLKVFINDVYCACGLRCNDGENFYKLCYVNSTYDEVEVWNIIKSASLIAKVKEKEHKEKKKKSILEG